MKLIAIIAAGLLALACNGSDGMTAEEQANIEIIRARTAAYNDQADGWLEDYLAGLADDFTYRGYTPWAPEGMTANREQLIEMMRGGAKSFPDRKTTIRNLITAGDTVVAETEWSGTASAQNPTLQPGERQVLQDIVIYRLRDGKIIETREYAIAVPAE